MRSGILSTPVVQKAISREASKAGAAAVDKRVNEIVQLALVAY